MITSRFLILLLIISISSKKTEEKSKEETHVFLVKTNLTKQEVEDLLNGKGNDTNEETNNVDTNELEENKENEETR